MHALCWIGSDMIIESFLEDPCDTNILQSWFSDYTGQSWDCHRACETYLSDKGLCDLYQIRKRCNKIKHEYICLDVPYIYNIYHMNQEMLNWLKLMATVYVIRCDVVTNYCTHGSKTPKWKLCGHWLNSFPSVSLGINHTETGSYCVGLW